MTVKKEFLKLLQKITSLYGYDPREASGTEFENQFLFSFITCLSGKRFETNSQRMQDLLVLFLLQEKRWLLR